MTYSLQFTEKMTGAFAFAEADYRAGYELGGKTGNRLLFRLTIATDDVDRFVADREHPAAATGYVECDPLGGRLPVQQGAFDLFVDEGPATRHMLYRLYFADATGRPLTLAGFKDVQPGPLTAVSGRRPPPSTSGSWTAMSRSPTAGRAPPTGWWVQGSCGSPRPTSPGS